MHAVTDYVGPKSNGKITMGALWGPGSDRAYIEWNTINVLSFTQQVVFRATIRVFLGTPLCESKPCRDADRISDTCWPYT